MADKKRPLGDEEILVLVEREVRQGVGWHDSKLSKERERVIKYYNGELPVRQSAGRSSYVSTDVYDSVESMKAQLVETFSGNPDNLVSFPPLGDDDVESSLDATNECSHQIWSLNDGLGLIQSAAHDGLTARVGIVKAYWDKRHEDIDETIENASYEDVQGYAANDDIVALDAEQADDGAGVFTGTMTRRVDTSQVCILEVPPEEFVIKRNSASIQMSDMVSHRTLKTRAELKREGYDESKVDSIQWDDARSLDLTSEKLEREFQITDSQAGSEDAIQKEMEKVMLYETFIRMDMRDGRGAKLWKVCHAGNVLLDKEEVDRSPFKAYVPLPVPHIFHGNNFAARVIPYQNARTVLTRAILDHASISTTPRWGVLKGGLQNPKEMQDNRLGGLVNFTRPDAVKVIETPNLNPFVFQTIEMLKSNKEESTGISSLSQGLNKDAISTQNSQGLIDNMVSLSMQRQKIAARNFAKFLVDLYLEVYRLVLENDKGKNKRVNVADWVERKTCKTALHLGYGERDKHATELGSLHQNMANDPKLGRMYTEENAYELVMDSMRAKGFENRSKYLTHPSKLPPPQPDPLKTKELDIKDKQATASQTTAQATLIKNEKTASIAAMKEATNEAKLRTQMVFEERTADRQDAETASRIDVAQREMVLLENAPPAAEKAIVSPA